MDIIWHNGIEQQGEWGNWITQGRAQSCNKNKMLEEQMGDKKGVDQKPMRGQDSAIKLGYGWYNCFPIIKNGVELSWMPTGERLND